MAREPSDMNIATPRVIPPNPSGTRLVMVAPPPEIPGPSSPRLQAGKRGLKSRLVRLSPGQVIPGTSWRITRWLGEGNMGGCTQLTVHATHGKAVFLDLTDSFLVVLFDQFADIAGAQKQVQDAAARIRRASRLA